MTSQISRKKPIWKYLAAFINKYRIEFGVLNGIILAIGVIEFVSLAVGKSAFAIIIGSLFFFFSRWILTLESQIDNQCKQNEKNY